MDKTSWIVVALSALGIIYFATRPAPPRPITPTIAEQPTANEGIADSATTAPAGSSTAAIPAAPSHSVAKETAILTSGNVEYHFTNLGGGLEKVLLKDHNDFHEDDTVTINRHFKGTIGSLGKGLGTISNLPYTMQTADKSVSFSALTPEGIEINKTYTLTAGQEKGDDYLLNLEVSFKNTGLASYQYGDYFLYTGSTGPLQPNEWSRLQTIEWCRDGDAKNKTVDYFKGAGALGFKFSESKSLFTKEVEGMQWGGVANQFFTVMIAPETPVDSRIWATKFPIELSGFTDEQIGKKKFNAIQGGVSIGALSLAPGEVQSKRFSVYTGPKEYPRLAKLDQIPFAEVVQYNNYPIIGKVVAPFSKGLIKLMLWLRSTGLPYGIAILIITCLIRMLIWPLHAKSTATMKKMSLLQPKMKEIREKYEKDPQKMNQETMGLYRDYGINPLGGCLPVFLQLPTFFGFYQMLMSAVPLRNQSFLWVDDLSMPDTVFSIGGIPINILPLLMTATMFLQMKLTPKTGDSAQQKIFMFMPFIFLFICYNFASALALYWTGQNIFSIFQTWLMNRRPTPELVKKPKKDRPSLAEMQKMYQNQSNQKSKKDKKRAPKTGG